MTNGLAVTKQAPPGMDGSIQSFPKFEEAPRSNSWILSLATMADTFTPWGRSVRRRDSELRAFWPTEPVLASALYTVGIRNALQTIILDGPPRTVSAVQDMLDSCDFGNGVEQLFVKASIDLYTADNGTFFELAGRKRESDAVVSVNHLDSAQCRRTGNPDFPVVWANPRSGEEHRLAWFQVIPLSEFPSPISTMNGVGYCALTRVLRAAQIMRDIGVMDAEKASGRFMKRLHLVGGVSTQVIDDKLKLVAENADNAGLARYMTAAVLGSLDPTATVSHEIIDFADLPKDFDYETWMKWYINNIALAFGDDYQTFAPLPHGGLGSGAQSAILELKSRGKGPKAFTKLIFKAFRSYSVTPKSVELSFEEKDSLADKDQAANASVRAATRAARIASGEITVQVARNIAQDDGDLDPDYLVLMEQVDANPDVTVSDEQDAATMNADTLEAQGLNPQSAASVPGTPPATGLAPEKPAGVNPFAAKELSDALDELRASSELLAVVAATESKESPMPMPSIYVTLPERIELQQPPQEVNINYTPPPVVVNYTPPPLADVIVNVPAQKELNPLELLQPIAAALDRLAAAMLAQEAPHVTVDAPVNVHIPQIVSEKAIVQRDADGNMTGTEKTFVYADEA